MALACAAGATSADAQGHRDRDRDDAWVQLGCARVGNRTDFDEITVGRSEGRFKAIRLEAKGNSVSILDLKVIYANGDPDEIQVRSEINEGDHTGPLDLRGHERAIRSIQIVSKKDFRGPGHGRAEVCASGLQDVGGGSSDQAGGGGGRGSDWVELGVRRP
jgi:hypothetical protein